METTNIDLTAIERELENETSPTELAGDATRRLTLGPDAASARIGQPRISVVIPTLNEALNLPLVFDRLPAGIDEVVVVDGLSTDGTVDVARSLRNDVVIVEQTGRGKGNALQAGFAVARGDIIVMLDADGSTDPAEIPRFVAALTTGADFAKGTRVVVGGGSDDITWLREFGNKMLTGLVNLVFRSNYSDLCYGYNAFWAIHLETLDVDVDGFEVETLLNIRALKSGLHIVEVPSHERARVHGQSNLRTFYDGWRVLKIIGRERVARKPAAPVVLAGG